MEPAGEPTVPSDTVLPENYPASQAEDRDDESVTCSIESYHGSTVGDNDVDTVSFEDYTVYSVHLSDHSELELSDIIPQPHLNLVVNDMQSRNVESTPDEADEDLMLKAERINKLRADDEASESSASGPSFSRACGVCFAENPGARAILSACGHIVCAVTMATAERVISPFCRAFTGYVLMVETPAVAADNVVEDVADGTAASFGEIRIID